MAFLKIIVIKLESKIAKYISSNAKYISHLSFLGRISLKKDLKLITLNLKCSVHFGYSLINPILTFSILALGNFTNSYCLMVEEE